MGLVCAATTYVTVLGAGRLASGCPTGPSPTPHAVHREVCAQQRAILS
jgi:hypothetical protein